MRLLLIAVFCCSTVGVYGTPKVFCDDKRMHIKFILTDFGSSVYLDGFRDYPDPVCQPKISKDQVVFNLPLDNYERCGINKITNKQTGSSTYYHRLVVEYDLAKKAKKLNKKTNPRRDVLILKCVPQKNAKKQKRDTLPDGFEEAQDLDIVDVPEHTQRVPPPILGAHVIQNGHLVDNQLLVLPGTPLQMEIFLDSNSTNMYGIMVSYMDVTDRKAKEETIIFNGCSVDPYLFENFNTLDGDLLTAKFKAFKFPESNFVLFRGTIDVCLGSCQGVECSNGQIGYGRKKRSIASNSTLRHSNKIFEVKITTVLMVDYVDGEKLHKDSLGQVARLPIRNQVVRSAETHEAPIESVNRSLPNIGGDAKLISPIEPKSNAAILSSSFIFSILVTAVLCF
ncbi:uncharacterized protein LOC136036457 [Artemia franciscana]|uniref:uncharacterized protein LOC136036457 n=1 Tax=Artemia franciscana TaxID=6661 RepID=UPI0032DB8752